MRTLSFLGIAIISSLFISSLYLQDVDAKKKTAYDQGYEEGRSDWVDGKQHDSRCNLKYLPAEYDALCALWKLGYEHGWLAAQILSSR